MSVTDSNNFNVELENYKGPLDVLLDLAKAQKVDLENKICCSLTPEVEYLLFCHHFF